MESKSISGVTSHMQQHMYDTCRHAGDDKRRSNPIMGPSQGFWGTGEEGHLFREQRPNFEGNKDNIGEQGI